MSTYYVKTINYANTEIEMNSVTKLGDMLNREFYQSEIETKEDIYILRKKILKRANQLTYETNNLIKLIDDQEDFGWYEELNLRFSSSKEEESNFLAERELLAFLELSNFEAAKSFLKKTKRLEILENSLIKKEALFDKKLQHHFATVAEANGQPLNDKRNGQATLNKWERQSDALGNLLKSIEKTKYAIKYEKGAMMDCEGAKAKLPAEILILLEEGILKQWRKHPNIFFVVGVDKARIVWDNKKKEVLRKFTKSITDKNQFKIFANVFNELYRAINLTK